MSGGEPPEARREPRLGDYRVARIGVVVCLVAVIFILVVFDGVEPDHRLDPVVLGILVSAILVLLGAEVKDVIVKLPWGR